MSNREAWNDLIVGTLCLFFGMWPFFLILSFPYVLPIGLGLMSFGAWRFGRAVKAAWFR